MEDQDKGWEKSNGEKKKKKERTSLANRLLNIGERRFALGEQRKETSPVAVSPPYNVQRRDSTHPPTIEREDSIAELISTGDPFLRALIAAFRKLMGANKQLCVVAKVINFLTLHPV